jgi:hypothetical protein
LASVSLNSLELLSGIYETSSAADFLSVAAIEPGAVFEVVPKF